MLKAEQSAVINQANVHMVGLRGSEVLYFSQFFTQFGIQAALIAGFAIGNVTQIPKSPNRSFYWLEILWITSVVTFALAMHVLISCILISVYGQGLALRGPTGSMVKAVEGMVVEQNWVVTYFSYTLFFLGLNIMGNCGIMMTAPFAIAASIITSCGMFAWYRGSVRIYNRFKFTLASMMNDFSDSDSDQDGAQSVASFDLDTSPRDLSRASSKYTLAQIEGYLTMLDTNNPRKSMSSSSHGVKWVRRYFVLKRGYGYYYTDRDSYQFKSQSALNKRRITFTGYSVQEDISDHFFSLKLIPNEADTENKRIWEFRCDTIEELDKWKLAFTQVSSASASQKINFNFDNNKNNNNNNQLNNNSNNSMTNIMTAESQKKTGKDTLSIFSSNKSVTAAEVVNDSSEHSSKTATSLARSMLKSSVAKLRFISKSKSDDQNNSTNSLDDSSNNISSHSKGT